MARIVKRIIELYSTDEDDLAAVDGVAIDDAGHLGDPEPDDDPGDNDDTEESDEEPEARPRSRTLAPARQKPRRR